MVTITETTRETILVLDHMLKVKMKRKDTKKKKTVVAHT